MRSQPPRCHGQPIMIDIEQRCCGVGTRRLTLAGDFDDISNTDSLADVGFFACLLAEPFVVGKR